MSTGVPGFFGQKAASGYPPIIDSVTLTELSPSDGTLFGNQAFGVDVVMTDPGKPVAGKALKGYIDGTFNEPILTDFLTSAVRNNFNPDKTFYAVDSSGAAFDGGAGSPTTSNFVSVAHFGQKLPEFNLYDNHFLAVTDDNKLAYSLGGLVWEVYDAGIPGAIFRKVQPLYTEEGVNGDPIFVACGELSGGSYFLATCYNKTSFVLDETLSSEVVSLAPSRPIDAGFQGGIGMYACTATNVYFRGTPEFDWIAVDAGRGPYQYADGRFMIRNSVLYLDGVPFDSLGIALTGGFDDRYDRPRAFSGDRFLFYGEGGIVLADQETLTAQQTTTASQYSSLYGRQEYGNPGIASVAGGVTPIGDGSAPLTYARDIVGSLPFYSDENELRGYRYNNPVSVVVGNGGQIIFAVKQTTTVRFKSDLNLSSINKYDTLTAIYTNTEELENTWLVLDKRTVSGDEYMDLIPTGDPSYWVLFELNATERRFRGGSTPVGPTRRYLGMTNYAGAYNNVGSLVSIDPGFTDQQTTSDTIPDIQFPVFFADDSGFNNRFEGYIQPGATFTVELKASNLSGSDTSSDTVTPS